jgi:hypothetical protein
MKTAIALIALTAAATTFAHAQTLPDCAGQNPAHTPCAFRTGPTAGVQMNYTHPVDTNPGSAALYEVLAPGYKPASPAHYGLLHNWEATASYALQSQRPGFQDHDSSGFSVGVARQWHDYAGFQAEYTQVQWAFPRVGAAVGKNGTQELLFGYRVEHTFAHRVTPFAVGELGWQEQFVSAIGVGAAVGAEINVSRHWRVIPVEAAYDRAVATPTEPDSRNPIKDRVYVKAGFAYKF